MKRNQGSTQRLANEAYRTGLTPVNPRTGHNEARREALDDVVQAIISVIEADGVVAVSLNTEMTERVANILAAAGYAVRCPGQSELRDGVTYEAMHVAKVR